MSTILIVDDEFGIAEVLNAALTDAGHKVLSAINGQQGLHRLTEAIPDLVLLDFMMPILDGPGMLRAMAADPAYKVVPVILMSAIPEAAVARECSGYSAFLRKPFTLAELTAAIDGVLTRHP